MMELSGLQVFKYLPAAKKLAEGNCKKCSFPTCMAFALKLAKNQTEIDLCPYISDELKEIFAQSMKKPQKEVFLGHKNKALIGGEKVLFRHEKTFINKTAIAVVIDTSEKDWEEKLKRVTDFQITRINETFKIDLIYLKDTTHPDPLIIPLTPSLSRKGRGRTIINKSLAQEEREKLTNKLDELGFSWVTEDDLAEITQVEDEDVSNVIQKLTNIRKKAVLEKDENYSNPVMVYFKSVLRHPDTETSSVQRFISGSIHNSDTGKMLKQVQHDEESDKLNLLKLMSKASFYLCKYANLLVFEDFNEALISTLMTLRQNIYTDPQKPLQVESKVYEFNNANENSLVFLTTNFALTYFAIANEIEALNKPAYLVVTPSEGMSVLTAWSAEKFTAQIVSKTIKQFGLAEKIKDKKIIIPGLLSHMKDEIKEALPEFEILVGPSEAYLLSDFVKSLS